MPSDYDVSVANEEFAVEKYLDDFTVVTLYRGQLDLTDADQWVVVPGDQWVIEVYDRAATSIWLEFDNDRLRGFAEKVMELTK